MSGSGNVGGSRDGQKKGIGNGPTPRWDEGTLPRFFNGSWRMPPDRVAALEAFLFKRAWGLPFFRHTVLLEPGILLKRTMIPMQSS